MLDLIAKLAKKKFGKPEPEQPNHEYMRLELELEELCSLHALELKELKSMSKSSLYSLLGAEDAMKAEHHLARMKELWVTLPGEERAYMSSPDREVVEYDELAKEFQEKEYLQLDREIEAEASVFYLKFHELVEMDSKKLIKLLGKERAAELVQKRQRSLELWNNLTPEQQDRNSLKRPNRLY